MGVRPALWLLAWVALSLAASLPGAFFAPGKWYGTLNKPPWNPPDWVFAPVWTALYLLMGIAAWLVWSDKGWTWALVLFLVQLVLNAAWTWLFFGLQRPGLALFEISLLWLAILATLIVFWRIRPLAGALLVPYLAWVTFALMLNGELWRRNPLA